jgi:hypothetical protein
MKKSMFKEPYAIANLIIGVVCTIAAIVLQCTSCTPAQREKLVVPTLTQVDAIGWTLMQALAWCEAHGVDAKSIAAAKEAIERKDLGQGIELIRKALEKTAESGEPVPPEVVALVQTAEGAIAAEAVQDGMRAISTPH